MNLKKYCLLFILCHFFYGVWAQEFEFSFENNWLESENRCMPCSYNYVSGEVSASLTKQVPLKGDFVFSYSIEDVVYQDIELPAYYSEEFLPNDPGVSISFGESYKENFVTVLFNPIVNQGGDIKHVKMIKLIVEGVPNYSDDDREFEFASQSVLTSGDWYKVGIPTEGIYKLDYNDLSTLGIPVASINPKSINVYANQQPELSHNNSDYRPDDLVKNPILIAGEEDLSFDSGDYILFYAKGPENLKINAFDFSPQKNKIDSLAYCFIHVDNTDSPKRLSGIANSSSAVTHNISSYDDYALYENNDVNLLKSGDGWYGKYFQGADLSTSFTINIENRLTTEPISLKTAYVSSLRSGSGELIVNINGANADLIKSDTITGEYAVASNQVSEKNISSGTENANVILTYSKSSPATEAWFDYMQLNFKRKIKMYSSHLMVRHFASVGIGNTVQYNVSNANSGTTVWEVTNPRNARRVNGNLSGTNYVFRQNSDSLRTFVVFNINQTKKPILSGDRLGKIANQNLHGLAQVDYLILTHSLLRSQADRLAGLHRNKGLTVHVVDIQHVYNEFSGGMSDPVAVRWFAKMFYDRAAKDPGNTLKYLCLFGDGTYDPLNRISRNNYLLPTYNSPETGNVVYTTSFTSDDFFGLLDDNESMLPTNMLDIGVGRIPVTDLEVAAQVVDKIEHYMNYGSTLFSDISGVQCNSDGYASTFGDWRNRIVLLADDPDKITDTQFVLDCEAVSDSTRKNHPEVNIVKIYLDAYKQITTSGGQRYPDVEEAINQNMNKGALIFNYVGHGGETGLSLERVVSIPMIQNWRNINNMPVFVSATCEFSRFDDPGRVSAGETALTTPYGGAVALLTTTRLVQVNVNSSLITNLYDVFFQEEGGKPLALGEIIRRAKNSTLGINNHIRHFALLGDPALRLGMPSPRIVTDEINGVNVELATDTLKALSKITVTGHLENESGVFLTNYNGIVSPIVFDKSKLRETLGQDTYNTVMEFTTQSNVIYKGKSTVKNGKFSFTFIVPKDIDYSFGKGKISYYSQNGSYDNYGVDTTIVVGGVNPNGLIDDLGPEVELFMNDEHFVNGGITDTKPLFLAHIRDENGVNTTGNGIGHDITLTIDKNSANPIVLNNFYEADLDTYQSGKVSYRLADLEEGPHQIDFKVWDVNNNSAEATLDFTVMGEEEIGISHLLNYPNPFTTNTDFYFEHNQVCNSMDVKVEIFTVSGKLVKTIIRTLHSSGFRSDGINWDGRDDYGDKLGRGVYVYRLSLETEEGKRAEKIEKLVIL